MEEFCEQQGEVYVRRIASVPEGLRAIKTPADGVLIVSHSESGHHHVLDGMAVDLLERTENVPAGMSILVAIVKEPTSLRQNADRPHEEMYLDPGVYEMRMSQEFNPFTEQARRVAD